MPTNIPVAADLTRTARFAKFLRSAVAVKTKPTTDVQKYPGVIWFSALPGDLQEVRSPLITPDWPATDPRWLRVARVQMPVRPPTPDTCQPWLRDVDLDTPGAPPSLNVESAETNASGEMVLVPASSEAQQAWDEYLSTQWNRWAEKASAARAVKQVYQRLFAIHQQMQGASDNFDLFVGVGFLDSRTDPSQRLRRHLLAFAAELTLDDRTGAISLGPATDFISVRVEAEFLPTAERARLQPQVDRLGDDLAGLGAGPQDRAKVGELLTRLITPLNAVARYVDDLAPADAPANGAVVSFGAALVFRSRSTRSLDALLKRIEEDATGEEPKFPLESVPVPWRKMMEDGRVWEQEPNVPGTTGPSAEDGRLYFSLPSNDEQSRIVSRANGSPGVVVQGPPGTGKSHTIANLISHYLANGRRVLVTAQSAQALEVLRDKMPGDLQQLCVTLLGDSRASDRSLRRSVDGILVRQQDFDPAHYKAKIAILEQELTASITHLNDLERTLHQARAAETETIEPVEGYRGTRAVIARRLREERSGFEWLGDAIPHGTTCPTYAAGWDRLAAYHRGLGAETRSQLKRNCPELPFTDDATTDAVRVVVSAKAAIPAQQPQSQVADIPASTPTDSLSGADKWLRDLQRVEAAIGPDDAAWTAALRTALLPNAVSWQTRLKECRAALVPLTEAVVAATVTVDVSTRNAAEARRALGRLDAHYAAGGRRRTLAFFKPAVVRETDWVEQAVSVEGLQVREPEDITRARQALDGWAYLTAGWLPWDGWPSPGGTPRAQVAVLKHRAELLGLLLSVAGKASDVSDDLRRWVEEHIERGVSTADLLLVVGRRMAELALAAARARRDTLVSQLRQTIANRDVIPSLPQLLDGLLAEDVDAAAAALAGLHAERAHRDTHKVYVQFITSVRQCAPKLADAIVADEGTDRWGNAFATFDQAWRHRCTQSWLDVILSREKIEALHRAARDEQQRQQETLAELTSVRAWSEALQRINDLRRATLTAWAQAVARIPASGRNVFTRRAQAQRLLGGCLSTIPAWVVSLGRLYETVEPTPGLFDVAIVDEASQCWLDSLVLFYLAKQVIVVGDDKQISPTVVGVADNEIDALAEAYLPDFQFRSSFTLGSSLFDHGRRYLSAGVPLREHFRCVPEIIEFSNTLCYQGNPLIPLRQVGKNRLEPLKRTYLPHGIRTGDINDIEAHAIVDAIATCHADPAYDESDFGVICLQGEMQGARIEQFLLDRLGPEVFTKRRLRCGNPYAFQGDERDVMFLSMVAAANARQQSLTTTMYEQRFNVAMSRARDQAWLFHSIQEDELGANCLRRRVLEFFRNPPEQPINGSSIDTPHLQLVAARADRREERPPRPFDSWFEVHVALALVARGYTMSAQVEVAHKRIDLVVEGSDGVRLAIECDGEAWHGADNYLADLVRQRQLERAQWRFVRVRESLFYSDEARAIREVTEACEELDISPGGERARSKVPFAEAPIGEEPVGVPDERNEDVSHEPKAANATEAVETEPEADEPDDDASVPSRQLFEVDHHESPDGVGPEYPDPRTATAGNVRDAVLDIIERHGPLTKASIYCLYRDGCPRLERAGKNLRHAANVALAALERSKKVEARDEGRRRLTSEVVYRLPDQKWIRRRPASRRSLEEVPLSELAAEIVARGWSARPGSEAALEVLLRDVSRQYGVLRLRDQARARLAAAAELAVDPQRAEQFGVLAHSA